MKQHVKRFLLAFNELNPVDVEIMKWLNRPGLNKSEYIKNLILADIECEKCEYRETCEKCRFPV